VAAFRQGGRGDRFDRRLVALAWGTPGRRQVSASRPMMESPCKLGVAVMCAIVSSRSSPTTTALRVTLSARASVPGVRHLDVVAGAVVLGQERLRCPFACQTCREPRAVIALQHHRGPCSAQLGRLDVPSASDAVDVLCRARAARSRRSKGLTLSLGQLLRSLHVVRGISQPKSPRPQEMFRVGSLPTRCEAGLLGWRP
jgi:hypothetical protein